VDDCTKTSKKDTSTDIRTPQTKLPQPDKYDQIPDYFKDKARWTVFILTGNTDPATCKKEKLIGHIDGTRPKEKGEAIRRGTFSEAIERCRKNTLLVPAFWITASDTLVLLDRDRHGNNLPTVPVFSTYTERTISNGYHVIGWYTDKTQKLPVNLNGDEIYTADRWCVFTGNIASSTSDINDITNEINALFKPETSETSPKIETGFELPTVIPAGERNNTLFRYGSKLRGERRPIEEITTLLHATNAARCKPTLSADEITKIIQSVMKYKPGSVVIPKEQFPAPENPTITPEITHSQIEAIRSKNRSEISDVLPELPNIFGDYSKYASEMSYAYIPYHFGVAMAFISMVIGRKAVMISTAGRVYLNLFIFLIGMTSISAKSTAQTQGKNDLLPTIKINSAMELLPPKMTPAGFIQRLSDNPYRLWLYDECGEFFSDTKNVYAESLVPMLCGAYDGNVMGYGLSRGDKNKRSDYPVDNVFLTLLWNTTDTEIERNITQKHISSGFGLRCMWFLCMTPPAPRKNRARTIDDEAVLSHILGKIRELKTLMERIPAENPLFFNPNDIIEDYALNDKQAHADKKYEMHNACTARLIPQAYKMAMLFSLTDPTIQTVIYNHFPEPTTEQATISEPAATDERIKEEEKTAVNALYLNIPDHFANLALKICNEFLRPRLELIITLASHNDDTNLINKIVKSIEKQGGIATKAEIIQDTRIPNKPLHDALAAMIDGEMIEAKTTPGKPGRLATVYRLLKF
jgi:hypothetical protein